MKKELVSRTVPSKADRQSWTSLNELKAVKITEALAHGNILSEGDLKKRRGNAIENNNHFLVP